MTGVFFTNHLLAGALIGRAAPNALAAFGLGVASHLAMDALPHWGPGEPGRLLRVAKIDGALALAVGAPTVLCSRSLKLCAGIAGACLLDLRYPAQVYLGADPFPKAVSRAHDAVQRGRESPSRLWLEVTEGFVLACAVAWACLADLCRRWASERPR